MTVDEVLAQVEEVKTKVRAAARRRLFPSGMVGDTSGVIDDARLTVLERTLSALLAERSQYPSDFQTQTALELRDHWEEVLKEIEP